MAVSYDAGASRVLEPAIPEVRKGTRRGRPPGTVTGFIIVTAGLMVLATGAWVLLHYFGWLSSAPWADG